MDNRKEECLVCKGTKRQAKTVTLFEVCRKCNGEGEMDWIKNILPKDYSHSELADTELSMEIAHQNTQILISQINDELHRFGYFVKFELIPYSQQYQPDQKIKILKGGI